MLKASGLQLAYHNHAVDLEHEGKMDHQLLEAVAISYKYLEGLN